MPYNPGMPGATAWPQESPFGPYSRQDTYNDQGLWMYEANDEFAFKTVFSLEYLYGSVKGPGVQNIGNFKQSQASFFPGSTGTFPADQTTAWLSNQHLDGMKVSLGRENTDGSGITMSGFTLFENSINNYFSSYRGLQTDPNSLRALWGISVDNGNGTSTVLPFDTQLFQKYTQGIYGADIDVWTAPFFQRDTFKLKFVWGAKYLRVHEDFYLNGLDSGLGYTAGSTGGTGDPTLITGPFTVLQGTTTGSVPLAPYSTYLASSTTNNLVGPAIGVRYELGGDKFKLWGMTKVAVTADVQQANIASNNWNAWKAAATTGTNLVGPGPDLLGNTQAGPLTVSNSNTHISPIFDTSLFGEFPVFELIPIVNQWQLFKTAKARIGWNYVYVNEVNRPAADITYMLHGPIINNNQRSSIGFNTVNFAVDWRF
jgi:hypothetical protein